MDEDEKIADRKWHRVYVAVIAVTIVVILALWAFSRYFSIVAE
jgi:hypothetical protein